LRSGDADGRHGNSMVSQRSCWLLVVSC
jgi:hypothetical protein